jgi:hypothetical protein
VLSSAYSLLLFFTIETSIANVINVRCYLASTSLIPPRSPTVGLSYLKTKAQELDRTVSVVATFGPRARMRTVTEGVREVVCMGGWHSARGAGGGLACGGKSRWWRQRACMWLTHVYSRWISSNPVRGGFFYILKKCYSNGSTDVSKHIATVLHSSNG